MRTVLANEQAGTLEGLNQSLAIHLSLNLSVRSFCNNTNLRCSDLLCRRVFYGPNSSLSDHTLLGHRSTGAYRFHFCSTLIH